MDIAKFTEGGGWPLEFVCSDKFLYFIDLIPQAVVLSDQQGQIVQANELAGSIFHYKRTDLLGRQIEDLLPERFREHHVRLRQQFFADPRPRYMDNRSVELFALRNGSAEFPIESVLFAIDTVENGSLAVNFINDMSEQRELEKSSLRLAFIDSLTHLPNRRYFIDMLERTIHKAKRYEERFALLYIDLDHFKDINDSHGHDYGDLFLIEVAKGLHDSLRDGDFIARVGGDEFAIILFSIKSQDETEMIARRILSACSKTYQIKGTALAISASVGVVDSENSLLDAQVIYRNADQAMYVAKRAGGGNFSHFDDPKA